MITLSDDFCFLCSKCFIVTIGMKRNMKHNWMKDEINILGFVTTFAVLTGLDSPQGLGRLFIYLEMGLLSPVSWFLCHKLEHLNKALSWEVIYVIALFLDRIRSRWCHSSLIVTLIVTRQTLFPLCSSSRIKSWILRRNIQLSLFSASFIAFYSQCISVSCFSKLET